MPSLKMTPSRKARTSVNMIKAANPPIIRPATGGMPHLTFEMHACGEGLNKGWLQRGDIAAVQVVELTAGLRLRVSGSLPSHHHRKRAAERRSEPERNADMARLESQPLVEALRVDAGVVGEQFDQPAFPGARFRNRPLHQLLADAAAAAMAGDANVLDQGARGALRTQSRQTAKLQATDHRTALLGNHELDVWIPLDRLECPELGRRQRGLDPFAAAAEP